MPLCNKKEKEKKLSEFDEHQLYFVKVLHHGRGQTPSELVYELGSIDLRPSSHLHIIFSVRATGIMGGLANNPSAIRGFDYHEAALRVTAKKFCSSMHWPRLLPSVTAGIASHRKSNESYGAAKWIIE